MAEETHHTEEEFNNTDNTEETESTQQNTQQEQGDEKTYTQAEVEKMMSDRVARERKSKEEAIEEAKKLAKMNEDERRQHEHEKLQDELAEYKRKDQFYQLSREASNMLAEHNIQATDELLQFVVKDDAETTQSSVNAFVELINEKVKEGVERSLTGRTPRGNTRNNPLTKAQILNIKDTSERQKAIRDNMNLFKN